MCSLTTVKLGRLTTLESTCVDGRQLLPLYPKIDNTVPCCAALRLQVAGVFAVSFSKFKAMPPPKGASQLYWLDFWSRCVPLPEQMHVSTAEASAQLRVGSYRLRTAQVAHATCSVCCTGLAASDGSCLVLTPLPASCIRQSDPGRQLSTSQHVVTCHPLLLLLHACRTSVSLCLSRWPRTCRPCPASPASRQTATPARWPGRLARRLCAAAPRSRSWCLLSSWRGCRCVVRGCALLLCGCCAGPVDDCPPEGCWQLARHDGVEEAAPGIVREQSSSSSSMRLQHRQSRSAP